MTAPGAMSHREHAQHMAGRVSGDIDAHGGAELRGRHDEGVLVAVKGYSDSPAELSVPPVAMAAEGEAATEDAETVLPPPMDCRLCWLIRFTMKGSLCRRTGLLSELRQHFRVTAKAKNIEGSCVAFASCCHWNERHDAQVLHIQIHASGTRNCIQHARQGALVAALASRALGVDCLDVPAGIVPDENAIHAILAAGAILHAFTQRH